MGTVTFIEFDGTEHQVEAENGQPLMQVAIDRMVPGIDADCGGECACGTCHVQVDEAWSGKTGSPSDDENQILSMTPERTPTSRLSCQIVMSDDLDGLVVRMPEFQM